MAFDSSCIHKNQYNSFISNSFISTTVNGHLIVDEQPLNDFTPLKYCQIQNS